MKKKLTARVAFAVGEVVFTMLAAACTIGCNSCKLKELTDKIST